MKIFFIQPTGDKMGHYGIYTTHVCQEIAKLGANLTLFTNKIYPEKYIEEKPLFNIVEFKKGKYAFEKFDRLKKKLPFLYLYGYLRNSFAAIREAIKYLKKNDFDTFLTFSQHYENLLKQFENSKNCNFEYRKQSAI